jgi:mitogen-activated protein kinase kinase kinase
MSDSFAGPSQAGPSRAGPSSGAGLGLSLDEEMDEGTRALIAQLQAQEEEENAARRRQLEADEELARREQQQERNVWEMMQEIDAQNQRTRREQIEQDELRAVSPWQRFDGYANV